MSKVSCLLFFIFVIIGCATTPLMKPSYSSRKTYVETRRGLLTDTRQAILDGRVIKGMSKEEVRGSWGKPTSIDCYSNREGYDEVWGYKGWLYSLAEPSKYVSFKDGKVVEVHVTVK